MKASFQKIGADVIITEPRLFNKVGRWSFRRTLNPNDPFAGLQVDVRDGSFVIETPSRLELQVVHSDKRDRHLLLMARDPIGGTNQKFLCGHDERDWFVASVPPTARNVDDAKDRLMPPAARASQHRAKVRPRKRHKRHNPGFIRQGEWFFIPVKAFQVDPAAVIRQEPLVRVGGGKPHVVEELYRTGGELVYVHGAHAPAGILPAEYAKLSHRVRSSANWRQMKRNPALYARGRVRHPDHATIRLDDWHLIAMNREVRSANLGFLD